MRLLVSAYNRWSGVRAIKNPVESGSGAKVSANHQTYGLRFDAREFQYVFSVPLPAPAVPC
ncbi:MAG: hypothetical protein LBI14_04165 [Treponema sp.]|nr:hypothetical protein [Treponema sp.]